MIDILKTLFRDYAPLASFILTTFASVAIYTFRPKVKLIWGSKSNFQHLMRPRETETPRKPKVPAQNLVVHSAHYFIKNTGRVEAKGVEIVLNFPPDEISIWPQRQYGLSTNNENRQIVFLPFVSSKESVEIFLLSTGKQLPTLMNVKCAESVGKEVDIDYHRILPRWLVIGIWSLIFFGAVFVLEIFIKLVGALWQ